MTVGTSKAPQPLTLLDGVALIFIAFKLAHIGDVADWSWWWVLSPLWIWFTLLVIIKTLLAIAEHAQEKKERAEALRRSFR